jgi:integrase
MRRIVESAGLPAGRRDLFHKVRRTSATAVANKLGRAAAQDHLGHSAMSVTKVYLDPSKITRVQVADILPRPKMPRPEAPAVAGNGRAATQQHRTEVSSNE